MTQTTRGWRGAGWGEGWVLKGFDIKAKGGGGGGERQLVAGGAIELNVKQRTCTRRRSQSLRLAHTHSLARSLTRSLSHSTMLHFRPVSWLYATAVALSTACTRPPHPASPRQACRGGHLE